MNELAKPPTRAGGALRRWGTTWGRAAAILAATAFQFGVIVGALTFLAAFTWLIVVVEVVLAVASLLVVLNSRRETTYKLAWALVVMVPLVGPVFYLLYGSTMVTPAQRRGLAALQARASEAMRLAPVFADDVPPGPLRRQLTYLNTAGGMPSYADTDTTYYPVGEEGFAAMLEAIGKAERYVFAEYFIVDGGVMLERLFDAMAAKAAEGLDVRFLYDDLGSFFTLPTDFRRRCREAGITLMPFNPVGLGFRLTFQSRDHRKILSVDGRVAFTGGINIADEYINEKVRFGHWKDSVVRLEGPGAWGLTVLFLTLWETASRMPVDFASFLPRDWPETSAPGLVVPFDDSPFDDLSLGWDNYRNLLEAATQSVDIFTPYLVISDAMLASLIATARSGVRVRIVTPAQEDKWYVHLVTRSFYPRLIEGGVEIYEYTPGFIHSKSMLVDGQWGIVGTVNFDFRSFFLHQECGVWLWRSPAIEALCCDVDQTLRVSKPMTVADVTFPAPVRLLQAVLRAFAPLL